MISYTSKVRVKETFVCFDSFDFVQFLLCGQTIRTRSKCSHWNFIVFTLCQHLFVFSRCTQSKNLNAFKFVCQLLVSFLLAIIGVRSWSAAALANECVFRKPRNCFGVFLHELHELHQIRKCSENVPKEMFQTKL